MGNYYPVYLNLADRHCAVFGGGTVAEGKLAKLIETGALVTVISPQVTPAIESLASRGKVRWKPREYQSGDLQGVHLGIAATDDRDVNRRIAAEAERLGVILNVVDDPELCGFIAPSVVERGPVTLAISTGGASPALARKLRESLANHPALDWADLTQVLSRARREIKRRGVLVDAQRWQCSLTEGLLKMAQDGREEDAFDELLCNLSDNSTPWLCPSLEKCQGQGCSTATRATVARPAGD